MFYMVFNHSFQTKRIKGKLCTIVTATEPQYKIKLNIKNKCSLYVIMSRIMLIIVQNVIM